MSIVIFICLYTAKLPTINKQNNKHKFAKLAVILMAIEGLHLLLIALSIGCSSKVGLDERAINRKDSNYVLARQK